MCTIVQACMRVCTMLMCVCDCICYVCWSTCLCLHEHCFSYLSLNMELSRHPANLTKLQVAPCQDARVPGVHGNVQHFMWMLRI